MWLKADHSNNQVEFWTGGDHDLIGLKVEKSRSLLLGISWKPVPPLQLSVRMGLLTGTYRLSSLWGEESCSPPDLVTHLAMEMLRGWRPSEPVSWAAGQ